MIEEIKNVLNLLYIKDPKGADDFFTGLLFGLQKIKGEASAADCAGEPQLVYKFQIDSLIEQIRAFMDARAG